MSSVKQVTANRANAKLSTGPKTPAGKRKSSMNPLKHGLSAETIVVGDEDPTQFEALRESFERDFQPETHLERELVERLVAHAWRLRRIPVFEAAFIQGLEGRLRKRQQQDRMYNIGLANKEEEEEEEPSEGTLTIAKLAFRLREREDFQDAIAKLSRYEAFLMNAFNRTLQQLLFLQSGRQMPNKRLPPPNVGNDNTKEEG